MNELSSLDSCRRRHVSLKFSTRKYLAIIIIRTAAARFVLKLIQSGLQHSVTFVMRSLPRVTQQRKEVMVMFIDRFYIVLFSAL